MTNPLEDKNLTREKLRSLITTSKQYVEAEESPPEVGEYDWYIPHHFNPEQLAVLENFGKKLVSQLGKTLSTLCPGEFEVTITSVEEQFVHKLVEITSAEQEKYYFLPFGENDEEQCGFISIAPETAMILIGQMLRDTGETEERELSPLEDSILMDIVAAIVDTFTTTVKEAGGSTIRRTSRFVKGEWPLAFSEFDDFTSITFTANHSDSTVEATFTILSRILESIVGDRPKAEQEFTSGEISNMIMERMHDAPISVTAQLDSTLISLDDLMNLQSEDVLLLGKSTSETIDVLFNGRPCLKAYPATQHGKYALVMAQRETEES